MNLAITKAVAVLLLVAAAGPARGQVYTPDWPSLDSRPLPTWFDESKIGIFIHWGPYAVPAIGGEWMWWRWQGVDEEQIVDHMNTNFKPGFTYQEFGPMLTAEFYKPDQWVRLFERAGARYLVLTAKHHDGYALWPAKRSWGWNAVDVGPHRDLVAALANAVRASNSLHLGLYYSQMEWFHPLFMQDQQNGFQTTDFVDQKYLPELYDLVTLYEPDVIWPDGSSGGNSSYWRSTEFLAWLYNESPVKDTVAVNDRWGSDTSLQHGGYWTGGDRFNPGVLVPHKWENCFTLDTHAWGWRGNANVDDYLTIEEVIQILIETVACGGNILVNVSPRPDGGIPLLQQQLLVQMGEWLEVNGDAIYSSVPHSVQNDTITPGVWYTKNEGKSQVYAMVIGWRPGGTLLLGSVSPFQFTSIGLLGNPGLTLEFSVQSEGILVNMPLLEDVRSRWAYTLVFNGFSTKK